MYIEMMPDDILTCQPPPPPHLSKHKMLSQCWVNVGPTIKPTLGEHSVLAAWVLDMAVNNTNTSLTN